MKKCEVCGKPANVHHIVHRCEGGLDFKLNYKYLCDEHHRGRRGPHKSRITDIQYKLELQDKLELILIKDYYEVGEIASLLHMNHNTAKRLVKDFTRYKEGYNKESIIYRIMGNNRYEDYMTEYYEDLLVTRMDNFDLVVNI